LDAAFKQQSPDSATLPHHSRNRSLRSVAGGAVRAIVGGVGGTVMAIPADRVYSESHEWHKVEGGSLTLGLTKFAVDALTDVTYVQMKPKGTKFKAGDVIGEVESVKTTSDVYSGVDGEITDINAALADDPSLLNTDPYGKGWLVKIKVTSDAGLKKLMDAKTYEAAHPA
jgi:glycine cleavage system H protein